jgi:hypothetical protein
MGIALAAVPAFAKQELLPVPGEIGDGFLLDRLPVLLSRPVNDRSHGHPDDGGPGIPAMLVLPFAMRAAAGPDEGLEEQRDKVVGIVVGLEDNVPSVAAIAAVGTAMRDEFFAAEAAASIAAIPGLGVNANLVNKSHGGESVLEIGGRVESKPRIKTEKRDLFGVGYSTFRRLNLRMASRANIEAWTSRNRAPIRRKGI